MKESKLFGTHTGQKMAVFNYNIKSQPPTRRCPPIALNDYMPAFAANYCWTGRG